MSLCRPFTCTQTYIIHYRKWKTTKHNMAFLTLNNIPCFCSHVTFSSSLAVTFCCLCFAINHSFTRVLFCPFMLILMFRAADHWWISATLNSALSLNPLLSSLCPLSFNPCHCSNILVPPLVHICHHVVDPQTVVSTHLWGKSLLYLLFILHLFCCSQTINPTSLMLKVTCLLITYTLHTQS